MAEISGNTLATRVQAATQLPMQQKLLMMLLVAIAAAVIAGGWLWSRTPDYRVLFANVPDRDGGAIIAALQQMNVPYKLDGGALSVPASRVHELRLKLASQGLPKGALSGFELMENQKFGVSQFHEQVNYQRALEGELARSIQSLTAVQSARVHIVLAKPTPFLREASKSTASVLVNIQPGHALDPTQVAAITHLVSNSVADLPAKNVSVVDQHGALLSSNAHGKGVLDSSQIRFRQEVEAGYVQRIEAILAPLVGARNVRAQVSAELDFSESEQAEETHKPNQKPDDAVVRSQQSSETSTTSGADSAAGVPGALSNQPATAGSATIDGKDGKGANNAATKPGLVNARKDSVVNYEVDRNIRHTRQSAGRLKRLSVAVVVNHRSIADKKGKSTQKPLSEAEIAQFNELVRGVMGYDKERGDVLSVVNGAFTPPDKEAILETPFWKQPGFIDSALEIGKNVMIAMLVLYLMLGVLRPMMRRVSEAPASPLAALPNTSGQAGGEAGANGGTLPALGVDPYDQSLNSAKQIAKQDPRVVANVVKGWVAGNA